MKISKNFIKKSIHFFVTTTLLISTTANAENLAGLQDIIAKTVANNPEVQTKYHLFKSALEEKKVAFGNFLPQLDLNANFRRQEDVGPNLNNNAIPERQTALILRQMIFDGFATPSEVARLDHQARQRYYELQGTMQDISLEATKAYIDILRFRQLVSYAQDNYITHKQFYERIQERVTAGVGRRVDLEQANGRLALAEANLLTETTNLHDVTARFVRLVGEMPPETLRELEYFKDGVPATRAENLEFAFKHNPDLHAAIEGIEATKEEVRNRQSNYLPDVDFQARKNLTTSSDGRNSIQAADVMEITANWNIFNGFSDQAGIAQSAERLNSTHDNRDRECVDVRQIVSIAFNDIQSLKEQLVYRDQHQLSIEKAREAYRKQYDIGQRTLLDLLDTENEYFQARRAYTNAERDLHFAYARTYAGHGDLLNRINAHRADLPDMGRPDYLDGQNVCKTVAPEMLIIDKQALVAQAKPLLTPLSEREPAKSPDALVPDVQFEESSAVIKGESMKKLDEAAEVIKQYWGDAKIEVAGHTDKRKTSKAKYNQSLSQKRAEAVRKYLIIKGIVADRITAKGYGFEKPIADNDPMNGNLANRRVELIKQK